MIPLWFLPFAIACGNAFVLKPSERDPRPSELIFELIDGIEEIPAGVCNLVHGGRDAVNGAARPPGRRRDLVRRPGLDRPPRRRALGRHRQALPGARRRQELARRDARRRPRADRRRDHGLGVRRRRPALPRRLGRRAGRRPRRARTRCADALVAAASELRVGPGADDGDRRLPAGRARRRAERIVDALERAAGDEAEMVLDGRGDRSRAGGDDARADDRRGRRPRVRAGARGAVRPPADPGSRRRPRRRPRVRQRLALRQRRVDLHLVGRRRARVPLRRRGGDDRRQRRRRRAGRLVPVLGLEGLARRRPARQRHATRSSSTRARRSSPRAGRDPT